MGYTTIFEGDFELNKPLEDEAYNLILERMQYPDRLQWIPNEDGQGLVWDGEEKFYRSVEQIWFVIEIILKPRGYIVNGIVNAQGEHEDDKWHIQVENNKVERRMGFNNLVSTPMSYDDWAEVYYRTSSEISKLESID